MHRIQLTLDEFLHLRAICAAAEQRAKAAEALYQATLIEVNAPRLLALRQLEATHGAEGFKVDTVYTFVDATCELIPKAVESVQ